MATFTLREFERTGDGKSSSLRFLGQRQTSASTVAEGKRWLSQMIAGGQLQRDRFFRLESVNCASELRHDYLLNIAFYLFQDGRLCPLRIWSRWERTDAYHTDPEWTADFEGVPGWSLFASIEPRWYCVRTVPAERSWMGRSRRDWQKRDCWVLGDSNTLAKDRAA